MEINTKKKNKRHRSWIWKYFKKYSPRLYRCNLCSYDIAQYNNMYRHVRLKHGNVYIRKKWTLNATTETKDAVVVVKNVDEGSGKGDAIREYDETCLEDVEKVFLAENVHVADADTVASTKHTGAKYHRNRSRTWEYFEKLRLYQYRCVLCKKVLTSRHVNNLCRHMRAKHTSLYLSMQGAIDVKNDTCSVTEQKMEENDVNDVKEANSIENVTIDVTGKNTAESTDFSWMWLLFDSTENDFHSCRVCEFKCPKFDNIDESNARIQEHLNSEHGLHSADQITIQQDEDED